MKLQATGYYRETATVTGEKSTKRTANLRGFFFSFPDRIRIYSNECGLGKLVVLPFGTLRLD